jgi:hypothetical protein
MAHLRLVLAIEKLKMMSTSYLLLQLEDPIHQCLTRRRAPGHINIHRHNSITAPGHTITIMIVTTTIRTTSHRNNPSRLRHLIINLSKGRGHLVRKGTSNNHYIGLTRGSSENYTKSILIVAGCGEMHHFDGAAGESKCHGPEGSLTCPVGDLVEGCSVRLSLAHVPEKLRHTPQSIPIYPPNAESQTLDEETYNAYCITPFFPSWLGNGTSRLSLPVTLNGGEPAFPERLWLVTALAGFEAEDEIAAIDRYGIKDDTGFAADGMVISFCGNGGELKRS